MTLCVAAECRRYKRFFNAIVFATDFNVEGEVGSAQIGSKLALTTYQNYPILMAGTQTRAISLAREVNRAVDEFSEPPDKESHPLEWEGVLQVAAMRQKFLIANEIVSARLGISYEEFLEKGKDYLPEETRSELTSEIARTPLDSFLLVLGFSHTNGKIYRISSSGGVEICENFAAIGSGYYIAEASLFQRSHSRDNDIGTTLYNVYEAMRLGRVAPGVGERFQVGIAEWEWYEDPNPLNRGDVKISFLEPRYYDFLAKKFQRFGPKPVSSITFKPRFVKEQERSRADSEGGIEPLAQESPPACASGPGTRRAQAYRPPTSSPKGRAPCGDGSARELERQQPIPAVPRNGRGPCDATVPTNRHACLKDGAPRLACLDTAGHAEWNPECSRSGPEAPPCRPIRP